MDCCKQNPDRTQMILQTSALRAPLLRIKQHKKDPGSIDFSMLPGAVLSSRECDIFRALDQGFLDADWTEAFYHEGLFLNERIHYTLDFGFRESLFRICETVRYRLCSLQLERHFQCLAHDFVPLSILCAQACCSAAASWRDTLLTAYI